MYQLTVGGGSAPSPAPPSTTKQIFTTGASTAGGHVAYSPKSGVFLSTVYGSSNTFTLGNCSSFTLGLWSNISVGANFNIFLGPISSTYSKGWNLVTCLKGITQATPKGISITAGTTLTMTAGAAASLSAVGELTMHSDVDASLDAGLALTMKAGADASLQATAISLTTADNVLMLSPDVFQIVTAGPLT